MSLLCSGFYSVHSSGCNAAEKVDFAFSSVSSVNEILNRQDSIYNATKYRVPDSMYDGNLYT